jgi:hypothetical protein
MKLINKNEILVRLHTKILSVIQMLTQLGPPPKIYAQSSGIFHVKPTFDNSEDYRIDIILLKLNTTIVTFICSMMNKNYLEIYNLVGKTILSQLFIVLTGYY